MNNLINKKMKTAKKNDLIVIYDGTSIDADIVKKSFNRC